MNMAHHSQLENRKYRNWVKAGLGLKYTKDGLEPFCDHMVKQQHVHILDKVKQKHNLLEVTCGNCDIKTLQPDHVRERSKQCPLGQINCNCQRPGGKTFCSVCSVIYDEIVQLHASTPPSPYWKSTDAKEWCTEPWAVAKCFINAAGYEKKMKASEFDCSGLLHLLINNMDFRDHLNCTTGATDLLQKVLQHRNMIYHSHDMELGDEDMTTYLDDMVALLQDDKELINMEHSKAAVEKLKTLKGEDFVITTTNETEIRRAVTDEAEKQKHELEQTGKEVREQVVRTGNSQITGLEQTGKEVREQVARAGNRQITDLDQKGNDVREQVAKTGNRQITDLDQKGKEVREQVGKTGNRQITDLEQKGKEEGEQVVRTGNRQITDLEQKGKEVREKVIDRIARTGNKQITDLEQKGKEVREKVIDRIARTGNKQITGLDQRGKEVREQIARLGNKQITDIEQKGKDIQKNVKSDVTEKGNQVKDEIAQERK